MGQVYAQWVGSGPINSVRPEDSNCCSTLRQQNLGLLSFSQFGSVGPGIITCLLLNVD